MACLAFLIEGMVGSQDGDVFFGMALCRAHLTDATVGMVVVIPMDEERRPSARLLQGGKAPLRELRAILCSAKERFHEGIVIADPRT